MDIINVHTTMNVQINNEKLYQRLLKLWYNFSILIIIKTSEL